MAKTKQQKQEIIKNLQEKINKAKSMVFTRFNGLGVKENEILRKELKEEDSEFYVAKKTLFTLAFQDKKIEGLDIKKFDGQIAAVFGYGDEVAPARIIDKFKMDNKENEEKIEFIGGVLENKFIDTQTVSDLAKIPGKTELHAKLVGAINAPVSGFVNALAGNLRSLVYVLKTIENKKDSN